MDSQQCAVEAIGKVPHSLFTASCNWVKYTLNLGPWTQTAGLNHSENRYLPQGACRLDTSADLRIQGSMA
jgi:hypothetical protein